MIRTGLIAAMRSGDPMVLAQAATDRFNKLSSDLALGHVRGDARIGWHVVDNDLDDVRQRQLLEVALATNRIAGSAQRPAADPSAIWRAAGLRCRSRREADARKINKIRLNMDRWRWLPRDLGQKYIIVNVPAFHATLVENGVTRWKHRAIAGAIKTPTPQLSVDGDRRDPQSVVGSADEHHPRKSPASPAMSRSRARTARSSAGASRRGRAMRSAR